MTITQAIVLGVIQGLTEFLPVSSSGHLVFTPVLFGWYDQGLLFDVVVHLGTLVAVIYYFRDEVVRLGRALFAMPKKGRGDTNLAWLLVLSIIPAGIVGFLYGDIIEQELRDTSIVAFSLIGWGIVLWLADLVARKGNKKIMKQLKLRHWLFVSCAQAIALIPGTSRSGITMTAGLFSHLTRTEAARLSFLMSIPVIGAAGAMKVAQALQLGLSNIAFVHLAVGFFASAIAGLLAIHLLLGIIRRWSFLPFVFYRIIIGVLILLYV